MLRRIEGQWQYYNYHNQTNYGIRGGGVPLTTAAPVQIHRTMLVTLAPAYHGTTALLEMLMSNHNVATLCALNTWECEGLKINLRKLPHTCEYESTSQKYEQASSTRMVRRIPHPNRAWVFITNTSSLQPRARREEEYKSQERNTLPHPWACKQATQHSPFAYPVDKLNDISVGGCESP